MILFLYLFRITINDSLQKKTKTKTKNKNKTKKKFNYVIWDPRGAAIFLLAFRGNTLVDCGVKEINPCIPYFIYVIRNKYTIPWHMSEQFIQACLVEYKAMTACTAMYRQGTSNSVSNMICSMRSSVEGFKGASVNKAGKCWDSTRSWSYMWVQTKQ